MRILSSGASGDECRYAKFARMGGRSVRLTPLSMRLAQLASVVLYHLVMETTTQTATNVMLTFYYSGGTMRGEWRQAFVDADGVRGIRRMGFVVRIQATMPTERPTAAELNAAIDLAAVA